MVQAHFTIKSTMTILTFTTVARVTDWFSHHNWMFNTTFSIDAEMTEYMVKHLLLCPSIITVLF